MNRPEWIKLGVLAVVVLGGAAGGVYLSGGWSVEPRQPVTASHIVDERAVPPRFPLSTFDAKDTVEAPDVAIGPDGCIHLAWGSKTAAGERSIFVTRSSDGGRTFDKPRVVSRAGIYRSAAKEAGGKGGYERRTMPHLAIAGDTIALTWCEALPDRSAMRLLLATSTDGGTSFGEPQTVHGGSKANPTFAGTSAAADGTIACAWLDDRNGIQQPFAAVRGTGSTRFEPECLVYAGEPGQGVCPCCPVATCFGPDGALYVAFRNIRDGYRDIAVCRRKPGQAQFEGPFAVAVAAWKFDGCPHDGPSLAVIGDTLHVVWMDARSGPQRCFHARASVSDMKFDARELHPDGPGTQGNAKLIADGAGGLFIAWEESLGVEPKAEASGHHHGAPKPGAGGGRAIMIDHLSPDARDFSPATAVCPKPGAFQTRPSLARGAEGTIVLAWMELDESGKAVVVTRWPGKAAP